MEDPNVLKRKRRPVLRSAVWGAVILLVVSLAIPACLQFLIKGSLDDPLPGFFYALTILLGAPLGLIERLLGIPPTLGLHHWWAFPAVNSLLGATTFAAGRILWKCGERKE